MDAAVSHPFPNHLPAVPWWGRWWWERLAGDNPRAMGSAARARCDSPDSRHRPTAAAASNPASDRHAAHHIRAAAARAAGAAGDHHPSAATGSHQASSPGAHGDALRGADDRWRAHAAAGADAVRRRRPSGRLSRWRTQPTWSQATNATGRDRVSRLGRDHPHGTEAEAEGAPDSSAGGTGCVARAGVVE